MNSPSCTVSPARSRRRQQLLLVPRAVANAGLRGTAQRRMILLNGKQAASVHRAAKYSEKKNSNSKSPTSLTQLMRKEISPLVKQNTVEVRKILRFQSSRLQSGRRVSWRCKAGHRRGTRTAQIPWLLFSKTACAGVCAPKRREAWVRACGKNRIRLERSSSRCLGQKESLYRCSLDGVRLPSPPRRGHSPAPSAHAEQRSGCRPQASNWRGCIFLFLNTIHFATESIAGSKTRI